MTESGSTIFIEADEIAEFSSLLKAVEERGRSVQIHPHLKAAYVADDAFAPLTDDEWPEECR